MTLTFLPDRVSALRHPDLVGRYYLIYGYLLTAPQLRLYTTAEEALHHSLSAPHLPIHDERFDTFVREQWPGPDVHVIEVLLGACLAQVRPVVTLHRCQYLRDDQGERTFTLAGFPKPGPSAAWTLSPDPYLRRQ